VSPAPVLCPHRPLLVGVAVAAGVLALVGSSSALAGIAAASAFLLVQAWWQAARGLGGVGVRRHSPASAFEEDMVGVDLFLENHSRREVRLLLVTDSFGPGLADAQSVLEPGPLPAGLQRRLQYRTFCSRQWGAYTVGPLWLGCWDPMGLRHARRRVELVDSFALYPRVNDVPALPSRGGRAGLAPEESSAPRGGQSTLFLGVRDYRSGDDVRSIHWPAMARRGAPMVREREVDLVPSFTLFVDLHRDGRAGVGSKSTLEYLVRTGASLLWTAFRRGQSIQVVGEGRTSLLVPPGLGEAHLSHALHELIQAHQEGVVPLPEIVERFRPHLPAGSTAALLGVTTAFELGRLDEQLEALRLTAIQSLLVFVDGESFTPFDRPKAPLAEAQARREKVLDFLDSAATPHALLGADDDLAEALLRPDLLGALA
jgi:uncharacterized protein (DUF58 family)